MKTLYLLSILTLALLFASCSRDTKSPVEGNVTSYTDCKNMGEENLKATQDKDESCIEYNYDAKTQRLSLTHINTGFNCCPGELSAEIHLIESTIEIIESEKAPLCACNCLFDMDIEIKNVEPGVYFMKVVEPYCHDQEKLEFEIDLTSSTQGSHCVERTEYPWNTPF